MQESLRADGSVQQTMEKYAGLVYRLAYARTGRKADAEDIFQEVFLKYFSARPAFVSAEHEKAWLIRITHNLSVNLIKSAWRRLTSSIDEVPDQAAEMTEGYEELRESLMKLAPRERMLIHLCYYERMTAAEIAATLGMSENAVRLKLSRIRAKLRNDLAREGYSDEE